MQNSVELNPQNAIVATRKEMTNSWKPKRGDKKKRKHRERERERLTGKFTEDFLDLPVAARAL